MIEPVKLLLPLMVGTVVGGCAAAPGGAGAPPDAEGIVTMASFDPPPVYALLGYRAELELTSAQIASLDSIAEAAQDENERLVEELLERSEGGTRNRGFIRPGPEVDPIVDELRSAQRRAMDAVAGVLAADQREEVCRLFTRDRPRPGGDRAATSERRRPQPAAPDRAGGAERSRGAGRSPSPWGWCRSPEDTTDPSAAG